MIHIPYRIDQSLIRGAGKGFYSTLPVKPGQIIASPTAIDATMSWPELIKLPETDMRLQSSVLWFEEHYIVTPEWPDDSYLNHSFDPNSIWHLGFVFALRDIRAGEEITLDYRFLLAPGTSADFVDSVTGDPITGFPWHQSLLLSSGILVELAKNMAPPVLQ